MPESCRLYLIRHGLAEERGEAWPEDSRRPLSEEGMSRLRKEARGLVRLGVTFDVVLTSPLVRARQTADIVAGGFSTRPAIVVIESLAPDGSPQAVLGDLEKHARRTRIALRGHEPCIRQRAAPPPRSRRALWVKEGLSLRGVV